MRLLTSFFWDNKWVQIDNGCAAFKHGKEIENKQTNEKRNRIIQKNYWRVKEITWRRWKNHWINAIETEWPVFERRIGKEEYIEK